MSKAKWIFLNTLALAGGLLVLMLGVWNASDTNISFGLLAVAWQGMYLYEKITGRLVLGCDKINRELDQIHRRLFAEYG